MTEWHPITAKFTSEEQKILDILRDVYGLNYNQSLKAGVEFLARFIAMGEYYFMADGDIVKKVKRSSKKHMKHLDDDVKKILKDIPIEKQKAEYEKFSAGARNIISHFDKVFVKNRKRGRKKLPRKRGRTSLR